MTAIRKALTEAHIKNYTHIILIEEHIELRDADLEVCLVKLVTDIPSERAELPPLLHHRVEEAQSKQQLLEDL